MLWKEFNRETQLHGLATTGGVVGTTGIAGLTLGGGLGWLMPKYGLALDNLVSAEMVMADGSVCRAAADENPDLFWAIRGGGGNFGIAASLEYNASSGRSDDCRRSGRASAPERAQTSCASSVRPAPTLPDEMMMAAGLLTAPDGSGSQTGGPARRAFRPAGAGGGRGEADQSVRPAGHGRDGPDLVLSNRTACSTPRCRRGR